MTVNGEGLVDFYTNFRRIRSVEERIAKEYPLGEIRCPTHLSLGQETVSAAFAVAQKPSDFVISTHRAHAHYLAKGGDLNRMVAELYGKVTGCSRGRGGSMHLVDNEVGFVGSSAIVGNSIPIGVGIALAQQIKKSQSITYIFLGDGAIEEGSFYESVNFAVLKKLRVMFVCENNLYSVYTQMAERQPEARRISDVAQGLGMFVHRGDGTNPSESIALFREALSRIENQEKPQFIEFETYRWLEHCGSNDDDKLGYRPEGELISWVNKDQLAPIRLEILTKNLFTEGQLLDLEVSIELEIDEAFSLAKRDPFPSLDEILDSAYAQ